MLLLVLESLGLLGFETSGIFGFLLSPEAIDLGLEENDVGLVVVNPPPPPPLPTPRELIFAVNPKPLGDGTLGEEEEKEDKEEGEDSATGTTAVKLSLIFLYRGDPTTNSSMNLSKRKLHFSCSLEKVISTTL